MIIVIEVNKVLSQNWSVCVARLPQFYHNEPYQNLWIWVLHFYSIRKKENLLYKNVYILYRNLYILYIQYMYNLLVHMSTGGIVILYIKMNVCLFGTKLCTHLPRGLKETRVWAHNILPFPPLRTILLGAGADSCAADGCWCHTAPLLRYIHDAACAGVTSRAAVGCAMKTWSEWNMCVWVHVCVRVWVGGRGWKPDEMGRKWLMNCTCNCIAFIQMIM
jgi:hypothetical protein